MPSTAPVIQWLRSDGIKSLTSRSAFLRLIEFTAVRFNYSLPRSTSEELMSEALKRKPVRPKDSRKKNSSPGDL